jgi:hypothetical protein
MADGECNHPRWVTVCALCGVDKAHAAGGSCRHSLWETKCVLCGAPPGT